MDNAKRLVFKECENVADFWGPKMPLMAAEELAELTVSISKIERCQDDESYRNLVDEMGDVLISVMALVHRYNINPCDLDMRIRNKLLQKKEV